MSDSEAQPPVFPEGHKVCGNCKLWSPHSTDARGWVGPCRVQPQRGLFPGTAPTCDALVMRGSVAPAQLPEKSRRSVMVRNVAPLVIRKAPPVAQPGSTPSTEGPHALTPLPVPLTFRLDPRANDEIDLGGDTTMTRQELMEIFREAAGEGRDAPPLANKWEGGVMQLIPGKTEMQAKELPIDALFHKIVMARDRLRTLEQKINGHPKLTDGEKVEMQQYITRVYGSFTSFNVLFKDKEDHFVGQKSDE